MGITCINYTTDINTVGLSTACMLRSVLNVCEATNLHCFRGPLIHHRLRLSPPLSRSLTIR